jgi:hypothetical protein
LDLIFEPSGTRGYDDLVKWAVTYQAFGMNCRPRASRTYCAQSSQDQHDVIILKETLKHRQEVCVEFEARFEPSARLFPWACLHCAFLQDSVASGRVFGLPR